MSDDIEVFDSGVSIRDKDGRFQPVPVPKGFTPLAFRNALAAFDTAYRVLGQLPSVDEVFKTYPKLPKKTYSALFLTPEFQEALRYRGIEWNVDSGLSMQQNMLLMKLSDPFDRRTISAKLKELGIPMPTYQNWMKQPLFFEAVNRTSISNYRDALPLLRNKVIGEAEGGNMDAIKLIFAKTGEYDPAARQVEDARTVVMAIVEAITRHVSDPETRKAIFADVQAASVTLSALEGPQRAIGG